MYIKAIEYTDYVGNKIKEDFYFNLNKVEATEMVISKDGGFLHWISTMANGQKTKELTEFFKDLILKSYGERSLDGKKFYKINKETGRPLSEEFEQSAAFPVLFMELSTNDEAAAEFINNVFPAEAAEAVQKMKEEGKSVEELTGIYSVK